jgi:hypothetical protein
MDKETKMFSINENIQVRQEYLDGSIIYIMDDFYKYPDKVLNFFLENKPYIWKENQKPSYNQIYFDDRRHSIKYKEIKNVYSFLSKICNQLPHNSNDDFLITNFTRFKKSNFNDYNNNYWWPHIDSGYTGILYLNKNDFKSGTNLYKILNKDEENPNCPEHYQPWRNKNGFKLIHSILPKYNRMILFDAFKFVHGMNICNDDYFYDDYRMNQVFFFENKKLVFNYY